MSSTRRHSTAYRTPTVFADAITFRVEIQACPGVLRKRDVVGLQSTRNLARSTDEIDLGPCVEQAGAGGNCGFR